MRHQHEQIDNLWHRQAGPQENHAGTSPTCGKEVGQQYGERAEVVGDNDSLFSGGPLDDLKVARAQRRRAGIADAYDVERIFSTGLMLRNGMPDCVSAQILVQQQLQRH